MPEQFAILVLTRHSRSPEVRKVLLYSHILDPCRSKRAAQDLTPTWAGGAWIFHPVTKSQLLFLQPDLSHLHMVVLSHHIELVKRALLLEVRREHRPRVRLLHMAYHTPIERTFVHFALTPLPFILQKRRASEPLVRINALDDHSIECIVHRCAEL